jgi:hypothetical protein
LHLGFNSSRVLFSSINPKPSTFNRPSPVCPEHLALARAALWKPISFFPDSTSVQRYGFAMKKIVWMDTDSLDDWPKGLKQQKLYIEPVGDNFWCYFEGRRSAGELPETPFHTTLFWLIEQIALGYVKSYRDERGDVVCITVGKAVPHAATSIEEAANATGREHLALNIAATIAEAREKGSRVTDQQLHDKVWGGATESTFRRMEMHYAQEMARLLGRIAKKLPKLEKLPLVESAPPAVRAHIAEATRCYLLKLERACIALCRACLETTLESVLTTTMRREWIDRIAENKRRNNTANPMQALIEVCAAHGVLKNLEADAHYIRKKGNDILHLNSSTDDKKDLAGEVLKKTRAVVAVIYGPPAKP